MSFAKAIHAQIKMYNCGSVNIIAPHKLIGNGTLGGMTFLE